MNGLKLVPLVTILVQLNKRKVYWHGQQIIEDSTIMWRVPETYKRCLMYTPSTLVVRNNIYFYVILFFATIEVFLVLEKYDFQAPTDRYIQSSF